ncbi:unnamed protein product [Arabidopsis lyrata]|uniref:Expressed protein n=2 Tax=Arabidopsis TaxID=3701 RepID=D7LSP7_ARALL
MATPTLAQGHSHDSLWDERLGKRVSYVSTCRVSSESRVFMLYSFSSRASILANKKSKL